MVLAGVVLAALVAAYAAVAIAMIARFGLSRRQAFFYVPFKLLYRIRDSAVPAARAAQAPVLYVVTHQSRLDPALMLMLLPQDTLHILDAQTAASHWMEPFREMARTIAFNAEHLFVSRRFVRVLKGKGRIAVYMPDAVEPDARAFRLFRAVARIAVQADARIVPIFVRGSESSSLALANGSPARPRLFPRLDIVALPPMTLAEMVAQSGGAAGTTANALFDRVAEARVAAFARGSLFHAMRDAAARTGPERTIVEDTVLGAMSYRRLLIAARLFAGHFARITAPDESVGLLLPNSNAVAIAFAGLMSAGRTAAMINYSAGPATAAAAVATAMLRTVVSSRAFVEKAGLENLVAAIEQAGARLVWVEDVRAAVTPFDKLPAALLWRRAVARQVASAPALVLFTSGSEGTPKGVVLSHENLLANAFQTAARITVGRDDRMMNVLPVFHAFGLTGGLILPLVVGVPVLLYPSPLHYKQIPKAAAKFHPTVLIGTDTFLANYAAAAADGDFSGLRFAVAGAEPVKAETRRIWQERFGVRILEGFGMTEAAPVAALNTATHGKEGSVGRLMPAMRARIEPIEGIAEGGRLWLAGPNMAMATIGADRPGILQPLANGWHDSGDIVTLDREGFVAIRGRAKRFAKIGGEMVSLAAVERMVQELWPHDQHAVAAVPDKRKGERLVLATSAQAPDLAVLRRHMRKLGATELAAPSQVIEIEALPLLASGKVDHGAVRRLALQRLGLAEAA